MPRATIVEVDFYALMEKMRNMAGAGCVIEKLDAARWAAYVAEHDVKETSLLAHGKTRFTAGKPRLVALASGTDGWDGCYVYSKEDEVALKFVPARPD